MQTQCSPSISLKRNKINKNISLLLKAVKRFTSIKIESDSIITSNRLIAASYDMCACIEALKNDLSHSEILAFIKPARDLQRDSPFVQRLQDWPRGYAGDFETINYMMKSENKAKKNTIAYYTEQYALSCSATQQHRNKIATQSANILNTCFQDNQEKNILSLACGSNVDLQNIAPIIADKSVHFTLFDMDKEALKYSQSKLVSIENKCTYIHGNVFKIKNQLPAIKYDLISIGGLFDYLSDKAIIMLLKHLFAEKLKTGGTLFFTNIAKNNPFDIWMRYFASWELIERSDTALFRLLKKSGITPEQVCIKKEGTNLSYMVKVIKKE